MTIRAAIMAIATVSLLASAGCHKSTGPTAATTATVTDYRTLNQSAIEIIIADKTGNPVTLAPAGPNKYTGTRQVPGDTMRVPVMVTVEENRIVIETRGGGLTDRQVITPRGLEKDDLR